MDLNVQQGFVVIHAFKGFTTSGSILILIEVFGNIWLYFNLTQILSLHLFLATLQHDPEVVEPDPEDEKILAAAAKGRRWFRADTPLQFTSINLQTRGKKGRCTNTF